MENFDIEKQENITARQAEIFLTGARIRKVEFIYDNLPPKDKDVQGVMLELEKGNKVFQIIFEGCEQFCTFEAAKFYIFKTK